MGKQDKLIGSIEELQDQINDILGEIETYVEDEGLDPDIIIASEDVTIMANNFIEQLDSFTNSL